MSKRVPRGEPRRIDVKFDSSVLDTIPPAGESVDFKRGQIDAYKRLIQTVKEQEQLQYMAKHYDAEDLCVCLASFLRELIADAQGVKRTSTYSNIWLDIPPQPKSQGEAT